jgi:hypothetical protein
LDQEQKQLQCAAPGVQQQIQMGCRVEPVDAVQATHGGNSSVTSMSLVASTVSSHRRRLSQLQSLPMTHQASDPVPLQHTGYPFEPNMHIKVKQEQSEVMGMPGHSLNSQPASVTPLAPGVQPSQPMIATQNQKQPQATQMHDPNFLICNQTSIAHSQGQPVIQPDGLKNHLLMQNSSLSATPQTFGLFLYQSYFKRN